MTTAIKSTLCCATAALALLVLACAACSGPGNTGRTAPGSDPVPDVPGAAMPTFVPIIQKVPWVNGAVPQLDAAGQLVTAPAPYYPPLSTGTYADFGKNKPTLPNGDDSIVTTASVDCSVTAPYELSPWVATSEPQQLVDELGGGDPSMYVGIAARWAGADDYTRGSWRVPGFTTWYPALVNAMQLPGTIWGTPAEAVPDGTIVPSCDGQTNEWVIHMRGAGFRYYGGNIAHILSGDNYPASNYCPPGSDLCPPVPAADATTDSAGFPLVPTKNGDSTGTWQLRALHTYWDVSKYDGISFWARRGPDSMGTLLVTLAEKHTSDDMNRQNETYCRRIYACHSTCQNYEPCSLSPNEITNTGGPLYRCYDPAKGALPVVGASSGTAASDDELDAIYPRCGQSACTFRKTYPDADFEGKECRPYTFTSGESNEYCFNADDPPPPSRFERCGDGFTNMVQLSEDWTFYTIPFSEMRQGGYGKVSLDGFDLKSVYSVTLGWGPGNVDFFFDNVSFYRTKK